MKKEKIKSELTLREACESVKQFHETFGLSVNEKLTADIPKELGLLRYKLMREENEEYLEAVQNGDLIEIADACGDMLYILCGTLISHGLQDKIGEVFREIQRSNMSKAGPDGKPIYREDGKVLKGPDYFKPNIKKVLD